MVFFLLNIDIICSVTHSKICIIYTVLLSVCVYLICFKTPGICSYIVCFMSPGVFFFFRLLYVTGSLFLFLCFLSSGIYFYALSVLWSLLSSFMSPGIYFHAPYILPVAFSCNKTFTLHVS